MHLKSIALKGFKSFPDHTTLEFGPGISVIVGPNGSGKSNITDAVLWALGEQSALAVRGQTMQDVIFAGSEGIKSRNAAEVEIVIDNSAQRLRTEFSELSITRRLDRSGDGGYWMNGARCRLVDVIEALSDSGLGKEMHSVISQGRVEAIIHSKPVDRTALIEEAAGLSKHRKRRRRAQLKLERTQDNLDRALDVEREARTRLRPLKRQAEAAELHARLERQSLELRGRLVQDRLRDARSELDEAERAAEEARLGRDELEEEQKKVAHRREETERRLAQHGQEREQLSARAFAVRSARERIEIRLESARGLVQTLDARLDRAQRALASTGDESTLDEAGGERVASLEAELARLDGERDERLAGELAGLERQRVAAEARAEEVAGRIAAGEEERQQIERSVADLRRQSSRSAAERAEAAARRRSGFEVELAALAERRRRTAGSGGPVLADRVEVDEGFERALTVALGGRLGALIVEDLEEAARAMQRSGEEGGWALVKGRRAPGRLPPPPARGAERLLDRVRCDAEVRQLVELLLADTWVVVRITDLPDSFEGTAITRDGTAYRGAVREVRRPPAAGDLLADQARLTELEAKREEATAELDEARAESERAAGAAAEREARLEGVEDQLRELRRSREEALEEARRAAWLIEQRRDQGEGADDARRAVVVAELEAERRVADRISRDHHERAARRERLEAAIERDRTLLPEGRQLVSSLERLLAGADRRRAALEEELTADEAVGEEAAAALRALAQSEYDVQSRLREAAERLTEGEVRVAHTRDGEAAVAAELASISARLGYELAAAEEPLDEDERVEAESRLERVERRRENIGPVNPLAEQEYEEAIEHVEDLERQRKDLEEALAELEALIRETDRRIRESFEQTFAAAAANFEDVVQHFFPGGRGRLRLVRAPRPRQVLGGAEELAPDPGAGGDGAEPEPDSDLDSSASRADEEEDVPGIEIEVTPPGKATKRLSLLSGGEKSLVALAFLFAVFLARPCPFYILDEVEAALDDVNIVRFLDLVRRYAERSQFIVITHQRRTMEAADVLYGVSMGGDGVSKVVSRRLPEPVPAPEGQLTEAA